MIDLGFLGFSKEVMALFFSLAKFRIDHPLLFGRMMSKQVNDEDVEFFGQEITKYWQEISGKKLSEEATK